jgi:magnesium chelatase family protein
LASSAPGNTWQQFDDFHGRVVEIEADIENGLAALLLVGLPDTALREARDRIRAAVLNSRES